LNHPTTKPGLVLVQNSILIVWHVFVCQKFLGSVVAMCDVQE